MAVGPNATTQPYRASAVAAPSGYEAEQPSLCQRAPDAEDADGTHRRGDGEAEDEAA